VTPAKSQVSSLKAHVTTTRDVRDRLIAHAREEFPRECCGILLGRGDEIVEARRARNVASSPATRFVIDAKDHIDARRDGRARGLEILGFYHSHPHGAAVPSATDVAEAAYPGSVYAIIGLAADAPEVRVFEFADGNFHERPLVTVG
jgi:proteasome lid subunit RPN8/RPN11